ncbi:MAG: heparinase II/III domain-containing protein, partial [Planctomycetota bacterium]
DSGFIPDEVNQFTFYDIPIDGNNVYVTLSTKIPDEDWQGLTYTYYRKDVGDMFAPEPESTLYDDSITFKWHKTDDPCVSGYYIDIGTEPFVWDIDDSGPISKDVNQFTFEDLPLTMGDDIYVTLSTLLPNPENPGTNKWYKIWYLYHTFQPWTPPVIYTNTMTQAEIETALGSWLTANINDLCALVSNGGSMDPDNWDMADAAGLFGRLYEVTGQYVHAEKAAKLLEEFADHLPNWMCYHNATTTTQDGAFPVTSNCGGLWGRMDATHTWLGRHNIAYDLRVYGGGEDLGQAYYFIEDSGAMENLNALQAIRTDVLRRHLDVQYHNGFTFLNYASSQMEGILNFECILNEPDNIAAAMHDCAWVVEAMYKVKYFADGWWAEGCSAYHKMAHNGMQDNVVERFLQGYSDPIGYIDPVDGTRFDNLDMYAEVPHIPIVELLSQSVRQPRPEGPSSATRDEWFVIGDTGFSTINYEAGKLTQADSILYGSMGHAVLGTGQANGTDINDLVQAHLHFGSMGIHEHFDTLNLNLFAKGKEIISETDYKPADSGITDPDAHRMWNTATAAHCTVVVDEVNQPGRIENDAIVRTEEPADDVPGIPDWENRWNGQGDNLQAGDLKIYATDFANVQVVEADAQKAYGTRIDGQVMDMYRRMIALVKIDDHNSYVVDIFRVKGGDWHDYMLHCDLEEPYTVTIHRTDTGAERVLYDYWFDPICTRIHDTNYNNLGVDTFFDFVLDDNSAAVRSFLLKNEDTKWTGLIIGKAQAIRRNGDANFVSVRRYDGANPLESVFVAVHHPYIGSSLVTNVTAVPLDTTDANAVALKVTLSTGRTDYIIHTITEPLVQIDTDDGSNISFVGKFAHVANGSGSDAWMFMAEGQSLDFGTQSITGTSSYTGTITDTYRIKDGDADDAFVTVAALPTDGTLNGQTIMVDLGGVTTQAFEIDHVEQVGADRVIYTVDDPGMTIDGNIVKQEHYPCWGITGQATFKIAGWETDQ